MVELMRPEPARVLMYSHDTFGLGHLRRTREIAHALVEHMKRLNVLIASGSSIAGAFDFRARVDFIKVPSVIKLYNGEYTSLAEHIDLADTLEMRRAIIHNTAELYRPDYLIVDKEPLGLRGELEPTLRLLKGTGCRIVLGLREVLDAPHLLRQEWDRSGSLAAVERFYDDIWVYGCKSFWNPLEGLNLSPAIRARTRFMGFLRRDCNLPAGSPLNDLPGDFLLVTAGGGGDGATMMHQVLSALEYDRKLDWPVVLVLGPFMSATDRQAIRERAEARREVTVIDFDSHAEALIAAATAVVSMGGYNTFCEILSFDARALLVPRTQPRQEQLVRARRAVELGLVDMIDPEAANDPARMAAALRRVVSRKRPSEAPREIDIGGLERCAATVEQSLRARVGRLDAASA